MRLDQAKQGLPAEDPEVLRVEEALQELRDLVEQALCGRRATGSFVESETGRDFLRGCAGLAGPAQNNAKRLVALAMAGEPALRPQRLLQSVLYLGFPDRDERVGSESGG